MKKRHQIQLKALLLLLVYLISNSPSILFHQHKLEIASYENATDCEKTIYFSGKDDGCNHKSHISAPPEKCSLCDNHTVSPHSPHTFYRGFFNNIVSTGFSENVKNYFFLLPLSISNRGPPSISSLTV